MIVEKIYLEDKDECMDKMKNVQGFTGFVEKKFTSNV